MSLQQAKKVFEINNKKDENLKEKRKISVNFRILFNYFQIISIIQFIDFQWPAYFNDFIGYFSFFSITNNIFSFDCFFEDLNIKKFYLEGIISQIVPFSTCFLGVLIFFFLKMKAIKIKIYVLFLVVFIFFLPSNVSVLFSLLKCVEIEEKFYLLKDVDYECYTQEHKTWVFKNIY